MLFLLYSDVIWKACDINRRKEMTLSHNSQERISSATKLMEIDFDLRSGSS